MARNMVTVALIGVLAACNGDTEKPLSSPTDPSVDLTRPLPEGISEEEPGPLDTGSGDTEDTEDTTDDTDTMGGPSYAATVAPIVATYCVGCHLDGGALGGLSLDAGASAIVNVPAGELASMDYVEPGDPSRSYLWLKLTDAHTAAGGSGTAMPQAGGPLTPAELDTIEAWILGGAEP